MTLHSLIVVNSNLKITSTSKIITCLLNYYWLDQWFPISMKLQSVTLTSPGNPLFLNTYFLILFNYENEKKITIYFNLTNLFVILLNIHI
jgi:hypothetical protein